MIGCDETESHSVERETSSAKVSTMANLQGKVAIVTGASSGIGAATAKALAEVGMIVVGLARRKENIEDLAKQVKNPLGRLHALKTDMRVEEDILEAFRWTSDNVGPVEFLINNAGGATPTTLVDGDAKLWKSTFDLNLLGVAIASREAIKIMRANNIDGHIINVNSVVGHKVPALANLNVYPASKFALTALTETLRLELIRLGSKIKVTSLSPGLVETEVVQNARLTYPELFEKNFTTRGLDCADIADAIKYVISVPAHVQITELTIISIDQKLIEP